MACFLLVGIPAYSFSIFGSGSSNAKVESDDSEVAIASTLAFNQIPPSSFVKATLVSEKSGSRDIVLEIQSKFNKPSKCETVEFLNLPKSLNTLASNAFKQVDKKYNQHVAYSNGKEYLSYVDEGDHGTWILGMNPGVDSGFVYIRPKHDTLVPVGLEPESKWKWSVEKEWIAYEEIRLVCRDYVDEDLPSASSNVFFQVGLYNGNNEDLSKLIMVPSATSITDAIAFSLSSDDEGLVLRDFKLICSMGKVVRVTDGDNNRSSLARLVNHELGADQSWRITLRRADSHLHFSENNPIPKMAASLKNNFQDDKTWNDKAEIRMRLKSDGTIIENLSLQPLRKSEYLRNYRRQVNDIKQTQVGDYLWTWLRHSYSRNITSALLGATAASGEEEPIAPTSDSIEEVFLLCVGKSDTHWLFRLYPFNRRDQMEQSILTRDTEVVQIAITPPHASSSQTCDNSNKHSLLTEFESLHDYNVSSLDRVSVHIESGADLVTKHYHLLDVMFVGRNPMQLIKNYIYEKEGVLAEDVSSCYMYHAGVSIPASLIYATEVMCVLVGAKPVNLVSILIVLIFE